MWIVVNLPDACPFINPLNPPPTPPPLNLLIGVPIIILLGYAPIIPGNGEKIGNGIWESILFICPNNDPTYYSISYSNFSSSI